MAVLAVGRKCKGCKLHKLDLSDYADSAARGSRESRGDDEAGPVVGASDRGVGRLRRDHDADVVLRMGLLNSLWERTLVVSRRRRSARRLILNSESNSSLFCAFWEGIDAESL